MRSVQQIRAGLGQLSRLGSRFPPARLAKLRRVSRRMTLPPLPSQRSSTTGIWGVAVVRDELDVLPATIAHLFAQGVDHVLIADNRSTDGTGEFLAGLAERDQRVHLARDDEPAHLQSEKVTLLAHRAWRSGASWIVPFDADEFWFARGLTIAEFLHGLPAESAIVHARFHHMVPQVADPDPLCDAAFMLDATPSFPGKVAVRAHPLLEVWPGNHNATRPGGRRSGLHIAHAQYRSPNQVARKVRQGTAASQLTGHDLSWFSPHWAAGSRLSSEEITAVFDNISRGRPDARIQYHAFGPMVRVRPLRWPSWDPDDEVPFVRSERAGSDVDRQG